MDTHTYIHTYTQDNYSNPRCACAPRVTNMFLDFLHEHMFISHTVSSIAIASVSYTVAQVAAFGI